MLEKIIPFVLAQRQLELEYPEFAGLRPETVATELPTVVSYVFGAGIILVGLVAFGALVWGAVIWLTAAGNPVRLKEGRDRIVSAFLGVIILLSSYIILNTINPQLITFNVRDLLLTPFGPSSPPSPLEPDEITLILKELPLGSAIEQGIWGQARTTRIKALLGDFDNFLKREITTAPPSTKIRRIADLNKYLKTLTEECQCGEMEAITTPLSQGGRAIACTGEPCSDETKEEIQRILDLNKQSVEKLLDFKESISKERNALETELGKFSEIEETLSVCQLQAGGAYPLQEYTNLAQFYDEQGSKTAVLPTHYESRADPLTFYCPVGGTAFDLPYSGATEVPFEEFELVSAIGDEFAFEPMSCPVELPLGQVMDNLHELAIFLAIKMERATDLIDDVASVINEMSSLANQFNGNDCQVQSNCIPNPCYQNPFPLCAPFRNSRCLQAIGGCLGSPGPRQVVKAAVEQIKELEDELFLTLRQTQDVFSQADFALRSEDNPINLQNIRTAVNLASSPYQVGEFGLEQDWVLASCETAVGSLGPDGSVIGSCLPRNFFACTPTGAALPSFTPAIKDRPFAVVQQQRYEPLPVSPDNCPEGWLCNQDVAFYNQYKDASEPVKELLSCMRERLNKIQQEKEIQETLGRITSISDSKLTIGTCDWGLGPLSPGGCFHTYSVRLGRESVSTHYGGPLCRYQRSSYAIDIGAREPYEKKYMEEIIKAAKECSPGAWIGYQIPGHYQHMHISVGRVNQCGAN